MYIVSTGEILFLMNWLQGNRANGWILKINAKNGKRRKNLFFMNWRKTQYYYECVYAIWYLIFLNELLVAVDCVVKLLPHG